MLGFHFSGFDATYFICDIDCTSCFMTVDCTGDIVRSGQSFYRQEQKTNENNEVCRCHC